MLHAILHGKLNALTPEAQRLEDSVTSTVFGTLALVERWDVLMRWLSGAPDGCTNTDGHDMWFWPTLRTPDCTAIPDVCVRIDGCLFVVEAKYTSGRNDLAVDVETPEQVRDQLVRQHICATAPPAERIAYSDAMESALNRCDVQQVFLVDGRRIRRARTEVNESKALEPRMQVWLVTWQRLDRQLYERRPTERWAADLRQFLGLAGLSAFVGFGKAVAMPSSAQQHCERWRRTGPVMRVRTTITTVRGARLDCLYRWRAGASGGDQHRSWSWVSTALLSGHRMVKQWRSGHSHMRRIDGGN